MNTPTFEEISPSRGLNLDEGRAAKHFLGKSHEEAVALFFENAFGYSGDFRWMGPRAFSFYYLAFSEYLRASNPSKNGGVLSQLIEIVGKKLIKGDIPAEAKKLILQDMDFCISNYGQFEVDATAYGDLLSELVGIKNRLNVS